MRCRRLSQYQRINISFTVNEYFISYCQFFILTSNLQDKYIKIYVLLFLLFWFCFVVFYSCFFLIKRRKKTTFNLQQLSIMLLKKNGIFDFYWRNLQMYDHAFSLDPQLAWLDIQKLSHLYMKVVARFLKIITRQF